MIELIRKRRDSEDRGFTLIELMVVVLIIAILIAIAIPTFLGARQRAQDRAAQSDIRNAFTAEKVYYTDNQAYTTSTAALTGIEPSLTYSASADMSAANTTDVYVALNGNAVVLGKKSKSGTCFLLKDDPSSGTKYSKGCSANIGTATITDASW